MNGDTRSLGYGSFGGFLFGHVAGPGVVIMPLHCHRAGCFCPGLEFEF